MNPLVPLFTLFVALTSNIHAQAAQSTSPKDVKIVGPGLSFILYPLQPGQATATNSDGYIPYDDLIKSKPLRAPKTITSISPWEKTVDQNGIVTGYFKIDRPGTYAFRTSSDYDRNELIIDGNVVCKFQDGENKGQTVDLPKGLISIISVGYAVTTTKTTIEWMPPGQTTWSVIPKNLFYRTALDLPKK